MWLWVPHWCNNCHTSSSEYGIREEILDANQHFARGVLHRFVFVLTTYLESWKISPRGGTSAPNLPRESQICTTGTEPGRRCGGFATTTVFFPFWGKHFFIDVLNIFWDQICSKQVGRHGRDWNIWQIIFVTNSACVSSIHSELPLRPESACFRRARLNFPQQTRCWKALAPSRLHIFSKWLAVAGVGVLLTYD